jgi:hypothetical protein
MSDPYARLRVTKTKKGKVTTMITSVKKIETMKAIDLPHTFDIRVGAIEYPFEIESVDTHYVYAKSLMTDELINIPADEMVTVLIPDTWENAALDIELGLMLEGLV